MMIIIMIFDIGPTLMEVCCAKEKGMIQALKYSGPVWLCALNEPANFALSYNQCLVVWVSEIQVEVTHWYQIFQ